MGIPGTVGAAVPRRRWLSAGLPRLAPVTDLRLVVSDLDGTLLDAEGRVPAAMWPLLDELDRRGIVFSPASGRQYATMRRSFPDRLEGTVFIAENGGYVVRDDLELDSTTLDPALVTELLERLQAVAADGLDLGVVRCGRLVAHVERTDRGFLDHVDPYYAALEQTDDLLALDDPVVKLAVFTTTDPEVDLVPALGDLVEHPDVRVVVSGSRWLDVMPTGVDKGVAVRRLQAELGVTPAQTVVFGDYLNDLGMLDAAEHSYAMADAHPEVVARARHRAPSHAEAGVVTVLRRLLDAASAPDDHGEAPMTPLR